MVRARMQAHPRVGGENYDPDTGHLVGTGSSPRRRGKPVRVFGAWVLVRLIPA